ncbi:MAG: TonB-dependent receptor, partial [Ignavibacteriaceae bacterium]|nr:TonB-dependent receptor [Ignavibacteriaceae bacterium]
MKRFILFLLIVVPVVQAGITGKLAGRVTDAITGEPLIAATIMIEGTKLGASTDKDGRFTILNVPPGVFTLKITYVGYEHLSVEGVKIVVDQTTTMDFKLKPQSMTTDEVVVTANTPLIQKDLTSSISVVGRDEIELLPVGNFTDLLSLQAGVVGSGSNLHIRGGRSNEVAYMIDGIYVTDPLLGGLATQINNDAIQEMSLLSGTFNAEYGNALSGIVNIVTRDGSDKFSGKFELRTSNFGVERYAKMNELRMNGSIEGAIIPGSLRFFLSGEQLNEGSYLPFGYNNEQSFFTKLTLTAIPNFRITLSNRGSKGLRQSYNHDYKYIPEQYLKRRTDSWQTSLSATHSVSQSFFYDLKVSYFNQGYYSGLDKDTSDYMVASARVLLATAGNGFEFWAKADPLVLTDSRTTTLDFKSDAVWQINNNNEVKFGAQFKTHDLKLWSIEDPKRNFPYVNNYQTTPFEIAGYIQDKIELPSLVINLGLRFDHMNANVKFRANPLDTTSMISVKPRSQFSPRVGIAHPITEKTKLHFAYGHFFQNPEYQFLFQNQQYDIKVREPLFGSPDLDAQRTIAYEVGVSHQ